MEPSELRLATVTELIRQTLALTDLTEEEQSVIVDKLSDIDPDDLSFWTDGYLEIEDIGGALLWPFPARAWNWAEWLLYRDWLDLEKDKSEIIIEEWGLQGELPESVPVPIETLEVDVNLLQMEVNIEDDGE